MSVTRYDCTDVYSEEDHNEMVDRKDGDFIYYSDYAALSDKTDRLEAENNRYKAALERLAKLGNGERYGNSIGNEIAREALKGED